MKVSEILKLNNRTITKEQLHDIKNTCYVSEVVNEKEHYIFSNAKRLSFEGYTPCRIVFDDNSYIHVFIAQ